MNIYVVIKLTGHLFDSSNMLSELNQIIQTLKSYTEKDYIFVLVTGGGQIARKHIKYLRDMGINEYYLDKIGITVTRLNAEILIRLLGVDAYPQPLISIDNLLSNIGKKVFYVMGGIIPGISTNAVAALSAEALSAKLFINTTISGGVFNKDPEKYKDAKLLKTIEINRLYDIISEYEKAGHYPLLDRLSINIIRRSRIPTYIIYPKADYIAEVLEGKNPGTKVIT
jgi:uridylate kinase